MRQSDCGDCVENMFDVAVLDGDTDPCVPCWRSRSYLIERYVEEVIIGASVLGACKGQY